MTAIEYIATHIKQEPGVEPQPVARKVPQSTHCDPHYHQQPDLQPQSALVPDMGLGASRAYHQKHYQSAKSLKSSRGSVQDHHQREWISTTSGIAHKHHQRIGDIDAPRLNAHEHYHKMGRIDEANAQEQFQRMMRSTATREDEQKYHQRMMTNIASNTQQHYQSGRNINKPGANVGQNHHDMLNTEDCRGAGRQQYYNQRSMYSTNNYGASTLSNRTQDYEPLSRYPPSRMVPSSASSHYPEQPDHFNMQHHQGMYQPLQYQSQRQRSMGMDTTHRGYHHEGQSGDYQRQMQGFAEESGYFALI